MSGREAEGRKRRSSGGRSEPQASEAQNRLLERCRDGVERALAGGADQAEVFASAEREAKVHLESDDVSSAVSHDEERFGIRVRVGGATGFSATNDGSAESLDEAVAAAIALARVTPPDEHDDLAEARPPRPVAGLRDPALEALDVEALGKLAGEVVERTRDLDARARIDSGWTAVSTSTSAVASSTGVEAVETTTDADSVLFGMAVDGERVGSFDYDNVTVCSHKELASEIARLPERFVAKVIAALDAGAGESFVGSLVLTPEAVAEFLLPPLVGSLSAHAVRMGRSRFAERLGERIAASTLSVTDDGTLPRRPGSGSFDREGLPHRPLELIADGVLRAFLFNTREARAAARAEGSTGHASGGPRSGPGVGPTNLCVAAGDAAADAMVEEVEHGILLTRFSGNTDSVSGDFSGVAKGSFLLRKGAAPAPIQETLISGNLYDLLDSISAIGRERRWVDGTVLAPLIRLEGVSVTAG